MTPYYQDKWHTIYCGDCSVILPALREEVGMVVLDPDPDLPDILVDVLNITEGPVVQIGSPIEAIDCIRLSDVQPNRVFAWVPSVPAGATWRYTTCGIAHTWQPILVWRIPERHEGSTTDVLLHPIIDGKAWGHPGQKPVALLKDLVRLSTGGTVLDPYMGSGSTLIAARELGRKSIGIEIEEKHCETAVKRILEAECQAVIEQATFAEEASRVMLRHQRRKPTRWERVLRWVRGTWREEAALERTPGDWEQRGESR